VACAALKETLQRALVVARQDAHRVVLCAQDSILTVTAQSQDVGQAEETLGVTMEGDDCEIAFNGNYLMQMLDASGSEEMVIELSGPLNSGLLHPADDEAYLYVLMPMQIMA
jgi:DNA polymerase-3 subunit beta